MSLPHLFEAHLRSRVRAGLTLDVRLTLGDECGILFGASGAGKTTILRLIAGLIRPDWGLVRIGDEVLDDAARGRHLPIRSRRIGFIFQDDLLFPHRSVAENIRFGLHGWPRDEAAARLAEIAALCQVEPLLNRRPDSLSGGERQRVGLARALAPRPRLLLCDEPMSALDLETRDILLERLAAVRRAERVPMLYVTHTPAEAVSLGDRLFLLAGGRIVDEGPPLDVLARRAPGPPLSDLRNVFAATVAGHDAGSTRLRLIGGPELVVPRCQRPTGTRLTVMVRADDVLLARGDSSGLGLSARNLIPGVVDRIVTHGDEAEVIVCTDGLRWMVSVMASAIPALELRPGGRCVLILKARSCHVLEAV